MSDDWVITPPCSPQRSKSKNGLGSDDLDSGNGVSFMDDWSNRMFYCMGEPHNSSITFHDDSYLKKNDVNIFSDDDNQSAIFVEDFGSINLFEFKFDKGAALLKDIDALFKMAKYSYMQLDLSAKSNVNSLGMNIANKKPITGSKQREEIVNFLIYVRNFTQRVRCCPKYNWMTEVLSNRLHEELAKLRLLCGSVDNLPDYILNYSASSAGNRSKKLQYFLNLLVAEKIDEARLKLVWKAHIALILLFAESNQDISSALNPILDMVEAAVQQPNSINLMRVFSEGFQDLIDSTNNLELGQYMFIGSWMPTFLSQCNESDCSRFLETLSVLISKMNSLMSAQLPVSPDNQLIILYNALWEHLLPYLKKMMCSTSSQSSYQVPDIAALLTTMSVKSCFPHSTRNRAVDLLTFFISHDTIDARLLCRYLGQVSRCTQLHSFNNLSITLIKGWLRCLILLSTDAESDEDLSVFTTFIVSLPEMQKLFSETQVTLNPHSDYFENFLIALQLKYSSLQSKPNSLLQSFLDLLLLPVQIRNPQFKLNSHLSEAIKDTFYLFVCGLFKLDPEHDPYIYRSIKELLTIYIPRLVSPKGTILNHGGVQFSLSKCFDFSERFELISKSIFDIICGTFIKKRAKTPHQFAFQALIFLNNLIRSHKNNNAAVKSFIKNVLEKICDVLMFCEDISPCKKEARDIVQFTFDLHLVRSESDMGDELMEVFNRLCQEHLAFTSRALFDLFEEIITVAPDLIARFLPQFVEKIKEVERKRGVGYDRSLRKGLERIEETLKNIRNNQRSIF
ncbi:hypothetical protein V9T40_003222 [Parthenolecanium corni]|uniref:MMS22-like C-terminal domain-containing protein n=1 Tax=Parthenolecanium corni TaxID=536013 RepID=A0AAN9TSC2_9HEMI